MNEKLKDIVNKLDAMTEHDDEEIAHRMADEFLLQALFYLDGGEAVLKAYVAARERVDFGYTLSDWVI